MASPKADSSIDSDSSSLHEEDPSTRLEAERSQWRGGYDCQFVGEILPEEGECPICHLIYRHPYQMRCCGKRICGGCVEKIKAKSQPCPFCKEVDVSPYPDKAHMQYLGSYKVNCPNRSKHNSSEGCEWVGELAELDRHLNLEPTTEKQLKGCQFSRIKCRFCFELFERHFINTHQLRECLKRPYECEYCEYSATFEEVTQQHSNECPSAPVTCPNNCELVVFRSDLQRHRNHDCPLEIQQCEFHAVGCQVELPRKDMPEHKRQSVVEHSVALSRILQKTMAEIATLEKEKAETSSLQGAMSHITSLESRKADITSLQVAMADTKSLQNKVASLQGEMQDSLNAMRDAMKDNQNKMQERITAQGKRVWMGIALLAIVTVVAAMHGGQYSMSGRMNGIQYTSDRTGFCTFDEHENCKVENGRGYTDKEGREIHHVWHNELDSRMEQEQKERRDELDSRMEQEHKERHNELDRRMEEVLLQVSEYETGEKQEKQRLQGQLSELQDQLDQEIKERQEPDSHEVVGVDVNMLQVRQNAILKHLQMFPHEDILPFEFEMKGFKKKRRNGDLWYSPPFYTDINGYKMCIRVKARGTDGEYISVAAFLMAGVADDVLDWPFREGIKIELINQARSWNPLSYYHSKKENHCKTFKFKTMRLSKSNRRVTTRKRALDGLQINRFISHDKLEYDSNEGTQYLKDDILKFRISASLS